MNLGTQSKRVLILGGTAFIGKAFRDRMSIRTRHSLTLLNRGMTASSVPAGCDHIPCDRDSEEACEKALAGKTWDNIVDFSGTSHARLMNILAHAKYQHYCFLSSSAVDLSFPEDTLFSMALEKLWCENQLRNRSERLLVVRPGFVVGEGDYTKRFIYQAATWVWKGTEDPVRPLITVDMLANLLVSLVDSDHTGLVRAGYEI